MMTASDLAAAVQSEIGVPHPRRPRFRLPIALVSIASAAIAVAALALIAG